MPEAVASHRLRLLTEIVCLLLIIIPGERGYKIQEEQAPYDTDTTALLDNPPMP